MIGFSYCLNEDEASDAIVVPIADFGVPCRINAFRIIWRPPG